MGKTKTQLTHTRGEDGGRELLPTEVNRSVGPATSEPKGRVGAPASPHPLCDLGVHILARKAPAVCDKKCITSNVTFNMLHI